MNLGTIVFVMMVIWVSVGAHLWLIFCHACVNTVYLYTYLCLFIADLAARGQL